MSAQSYGSIVAMEFKARPAISFSEFVEDFNLAFQMVDSRLHALKWEADDVAIVDRDYVRVALGWLPAAGKRKPWHIVIAVGAAPEVDMNSVEPASYDFVADRILDRTAEFLPATAVLRGQASQPVGVELVDTLFDLLEMETADLPGDTEAPAAVIRDRETDDYADMVDSMLPPWAHGVEQHSVEAPTAPNHDEIASPFETRTKMRETPATTFFSVGGTDCSDPMRLTIHTLALSICLYVPPLGAAMFAYTMLRDIFPMATAAI